MFHSYKSINEVFSLYRRNRPISAVKCKNGIYYIVVTPKGSEMQNGINVTFRYVSSIPTLSMHFHEMKMDLSMSKKDLASFKADDIDSFLLLLPQVTLKGFINVESMSYYYVIDLSLIHI